MRATDDELQDLLHDDETEPTLTTSLRETVVARVRDARTMSRLDAVRLGIFASCVLLLAALGAAATASALSPDRRTRFLTHHGWLFQTLTPTRLVTLLGLVGIVHLLLPGRRRGGRVGLAVFFAALSLAIAGVTLEATFAPPGNWGQQWSANYAPSGNLTEGLQLAANLREGHGYTLDSGAVDTYRMPGYALLVATAGALADAPPRDYRAVAAATIWLQLCLTALALGVFAYVAASRFRRFTVVLMLAVLAALPANAQFTQGDSVIVAAALLVTAALLPFLDRARGDEARWRDVLLLHGSFAFYFLIRTDVALAWGVVSLMVHRRRWRHLLVWPALFVAIATGFGAYARTHGSEFTFGTNNTGHVAFVGLWELPQDRFAWEPSDASFDQWVSANGYTYDGPGTNAFAEKEMLRFYATFPGFTATMAAVKAIRYFDTTSVDVFYTPSPVRLVQDLRMKLRNGVAWLLMSALLAALVVGYRRYETALLGWFALFVLPLFFVVQDESRFTLFGVASLTIAGLPLLLDRGFYQRLFERRLLSIALVAFFAWLWIYHGWIESTLLDWDAFRYWTPLLDPNDSTLAVRPG